ncbi:uncharacterized protein A4U43_C01F14710 [Asparagus officinalis]|uniref:Uncharacterized protein n=1 Tax=Asparagus officinalis TaxID=4686 RepID=A0A5P1FR26_ASPOF|nr:uncharacterized protein A4U43_C01F14710 [Asparagus officinalis]
MEEEEEEQVHEAVMIGDDDSANVGGRASMATTMEGREEKVKGPWSSEEDAVQSILVIKLGTWNWNFIAQGIAGRSRKSCKLRWCNQLAPYAEGGHTGPPSNFKSYLQDSDFTNYVVSVTSFSSSFKNYSDGDNLLLDTFHRYSVTPSTTKTPSPSTPSAGTSSPPTSPPTPHFLFLYSVHNITIRVFIKVDDFDFHLLKLMWSAAAYLFVIKAKVLRGEKM